MGEVDETWGVAPTTMSLSKDHHYMRIQGRCLALWELWALHRGNDTRGEVVDHGISISKLFGSYEENDMIGPDPFYKLQVLKDEAKNNKVGRLEITGATRHRDPAFCCINATATMLILRFGRDGVIGQLPDFFNFNDDWPSYHAFLTQSNGWGVLPYTGCVSEPGHVQLFADMKQVAGLLGIMAHTATKMRSFGAMHAHARRASPPEIERMGRSAPPPRLPRRGYPAAATPPRP